MGVVHSFKPTKNYTMQSNDIVFNKDLGILARGILMIYLALPEGYRVNNEWLARQTKIEGRRVLASAVDELIQAGYYKRIRRQDESGRWTTDTYVTEVPWVFPDAATQLSTGVPPEAEDDNEDEIDANAQVAPTDRIRTVGTPTVGEPTVGKRSGLVRTIEKELSVKRVSPPEATTRSVDPEPARPNWERPARRLRAVADDNGSEGSAIVGATARNAQAQRQREEVRPEATGAAGLSNEFARLAREHGENKPGAVNKGALGRTFRQWLDEGYTPGELRKMLTAFFEFPDERRSQGDRPLWQQFTFDATRLYTKATTPQRDTVDSRKQDREWAQQELERNAARGDIRAQMALDGTNKPWLTRRSPSADEGAS
jgi:hypothetical protein